MHHLREAEQRRTSTPEMMRNLPRPQKDRQNRAVAHYSRLQSQENKRKITIYVKSIVFLFWESSGLEMAGWLAGLGVGQAGWAGRQDGWSCQLPGQLASRPSPARNFPKKEKKKVYFT